MYIRKKYKRNKSTNKKYFVYQLIESIRTERGPRQRILLHIGSNLDLSEADLKALANRIEELITGNASLFKSSKEVESLAKIFSKQLIKKESQSVKINNNNEDYQLVNINSIIHENSRTFGVEYICYQTLKKLKIDKKLQQLNLSKRQIEVCIGVIIGRLVNPKSERATFNWLKNLSALDEIMNTNFNNLSLDTVYKAGDYLLKHKDNLENHLADREKSLFSFKDTIFLYDLTNTFFEGKAKGISLAKRGHSKENRTDCPLVTLGLVLNQHGFPCKTKVLPGNISEPETLKDVIESLAISCNPIIVIDAGIATKDNLKYLRSKEYRYIVASRNRSCKLPEEDSDFKIVKANRDNVVKAKKITKNENGEIELICHSEACEKKELSMLFTLKKRFEEDLQKTKDSLHKKKGTKLLTKILQKIGRLKEKHKKISSYFDIEIIPDKQNKNAIDITWLEKKEKLDNRFQGAYLLKSYGLDWSEKDLWNTYIMLTEVEYSFKCLKTDLGFRPIHHKIDRRVKAHLFISVIAFHIMQTIIYQLKLAGIFINFETIKENMRSQIRVSTSMKIKDGRQLHARSSTALEPSHKQIYNALKLSHNLEDLEISYF